MPKRVAVIDIGSNSARLVIYQRTSRYGFHLITQKRVELECERVLIREVESFKKRE